MVEYRGRGVAKEVIENAYQYCLDFERCELGDKVVEFGLGLKDGKRDSIINLLTNSKHCYDMPYSPLGYYDRRGLFTDIWVLVHTDEKYPYCLKVGQKLGNKVVRFREGGGL